MHDATSITDGLDEEARVHVTNVADNLQLVADLGYGDVALAVAVKGDLLRVMADARPMTAVAAVAHSRAGGILEPHDEPEAYEALRDGRSIAGDRRRTTRGIIYTTTAYPLGDPVIGVVLRDLTLQVSESPGRMERQFMALAEDLLDVLCDGPLRTVRTGEPFFTTRRAGDGVMRVDGGRRIAYASPNAVNIMRLAGMEGSPIGTDVGMLPGGAVAVAPVVESGGALETEVGIAGRVLLYRTIALRSGAAVLVEDITEARRRDAELKVKDATIREVHHRVKNNLQTISSLLRIQARRSGSPEVSRALAEAVERVSSMAVVHELLSTATDEMVDVGDAARPVVDMVSRGLAGRGGAVKVEVEGATGPVSASVATSLALVIAELVHNAIEHGLAGRPNGRVDVSMRRLPGELFLQVRDDGSGLPADFDIGRSAHLGLAIVRTLVEDDLRGTLSFGGARGTTVTIRVPIEE